MFEFLKRNAGNVININDMDNVIGKAEIIDIREPYEFRGGSLKTAKNIPMGQLLENPGKYLDKEKEYYIMCQSGARSSRTCAALTKHGYKVINVSGGMGSYAGTKRN